MFKKLASMFNTEEDLKSKVESTDPVSVDTVNLNKLEVDSLLQVGKNVHTTDDWHYYEVDEKLKKARNYGK